MKNTRPSSIALKSVTFLLVFFIFSIVVFIYSLMYGFKFNHLSFGGINIGALYLKYDKKLFLQLNDFDYNGDKFDLNAVISSTNGKIIIDIENLYYQNVQINLKGKLPLSFDEIKKLKDGFKKDLTFSNATVTFNKALSPVLAEKLFVQFSDDIHFRFLHPTLDGIKLDNSTIDIVDLKNDGILKIYLNMHNILDRKILKILGTYEVDLPLKQIEGETHTNINIDIPFAEDLGTVVTAFVKVKNGVIAFGDNHLNIKQTPSSPKTKVNVFVELKNNKVLFDEYIVYSDLIKARYEDKILKVVSKQNILKNQESIALATLENLNFRIKDKMLKYGVDLKDQKMNSITLLGDANLYKQTTQGKMNLQHLKYEDKAQLENQTLSYSVSNNPLNILINGDLELNAKLENNETKIVNLKNFNLNYKDKIAIINTGIDDGKNLFFLENITNFDKNETMGKFYINNFIFDNRIKISNQVLNYNLGHEPLVLTMNGNMGMLFKSKEDGEDKAILFSNLIARYENNTATIDGDLIENQNKITFHDTTYLDENISKGKLFISNMEYKDIAKIKNQTVDFELTHQPIEAHFFGDFKVVLNEKDYTKELSLNGFDALYSDDMIKIKTNVDEGDNSLYFTNITNLDTKVAKGSLNIKDFSFKPYLNLKNEFLQYNVDFKDKIKATIPKYSLTYEKNQENREVLNIGRLNNLLDKFEYIKNKKLQDGTLHLSTADNFKETNIIVNDLAVDINSNLFSQNQSETNVADKNHTIQDLPKISLKMFNSKISIDNSYDINAVSLLANTNKQIIDVKYLPQDEKNIIKFHKDGDIFSLKANNVSDKFIENITKKNIFDGGQFTIDLNGNKTNLYGEIYTENTTVKNVKILNNLITFINTTPAIVSPVLALPTLFRMSESGFDITGYPIKEGDVKFNYLYDSKLLTLESFYTKSDMMDFRGKGKVDIANQKLEAGLDAIFLKDYSKLLKHIPLVGYVIMGEDGNFAVNVNINGTFEEQEFTTDIIRNATEGTVNIIKRTFITPFRLFELVEEIDKNNTTEEGK